MGDTCYAQRVADLERDVRQLTDELEERKRHPLEERVRELEDLAEAYQKRYDELRALINTAVETHYVKGEK